MHEENKELQVSDFSAAWSAAEPEIDHFLRGLPETTTIKETAKGRFLASFRPAAQGAITSMALLYSRSAALRVLTPSVLVKYRPWWFGGDSRIFSFDGGDGSLKRMLN